MTDIGAVTVAQEGLMYQRTIFINPPVTRQWVDIKVFAVPATLDDRSALAAMIAHVRYRDSYASSTFEDAKNIHGPYWLRAITPDSFVVVDPDAADAVIRTWAEYYEPWPQPDRDAMDREVYRRIDAATVIYQLPDIRATAQHDWGEVVGGDGFHEFVAINRSTAELALIVASDD